MEWTLFSFMFFFLFHRMKRGIDKTIKPVFPMWNCRLEREVFFFFSKKKISSEINAWVELAGCRYRCCLVLLAVAASSPHMSKSASYFSWLIKLFWNLFSKEVMLTAYLGNAQFQALTFLIWLLRFHFQEFEQWKKMGSRDQYDRISFRIRRLWCFNRNIPPPFCASSSCSSSTSWLWYHQHQRYGVFSYLEVSNTATVQSVPVTSVDE